MGFGKPWTRGTRVRPTRHSSSPLLRLCPLPTLNSNPPGPLVIPIQRPAFPRTSPKFSKID